MSAQAICPKCFALMDANAVEKHQEQKCFPLMLKPMDIIIRTTCPVNVVAHMLERFGIPIIQASVEYPTTVYNEPPNPPTPSSPISASGFQKFRKAHLEQVSSSDSDSDSDSEKVDLKTPIYPVKKKKINP
jgi:hypothetical protein